MEHKACNEIPILAKTVLPKRSNSDALSAVLQIALNETGSRIEDFERQTGGEP